MSDLIKRLRRPSSNPGAAVQRMEAADELERQELFLEKQAKEIAELKHSATVMKSYYDQVFADGGTRIDELKKQLTTLRTVAKEMAKALEVAYDCIKLYSHPGSRLVARALAHWKELEK